MFDRGYLNLMIRDEAGAVRRLLRPNDLFKVEARRWFRFLIDGNTPTSVELIGMPTLKGGHTYNTEQVPHPRPLNGNSEVGAGVLLGTTGEVMRYRSKGTKTSGTPAFPSQIAYALGSVGVISDVIISPQPMYSAADFGLRQIGNVFGHPSGRRAFFTEPAITPNGLGAVNNSGPLALGPAEFWHYIYDVRVLQNGDDGSIGPAARYAWQRRPYHLGAYEAGAGLGDFEIAGASDTLATRFPGPLGGRAQLFIGNMVNNHASPNPPEEPYNLGWPDPSASQNNVCPAIVSDEQDPQRIWMAISNTLANDNANAANGRSLWSWKSYAWESPERRDFPGQFADDSLTGFPSLGSSVQFRDLRMSRAGLMFVACDGADDANDSISGTGQNNGALVVIDVTAGNEAVVAVLGETAGGIYTGGGLRRNNCLAVAIDRSEAYAAAGFDRIWVLHRNGLSYADLNISTKAIGAWTTVADAGADQNILEADSIRGIANFVPVGSGGQRNFHSPMLGVDGAGNVYFVTTQTGGTYVTGGPQRLNRLLGDASAHTFYSINDAAEAGPPTGSQGFIRLGAKFGGVTHTIACLRIFRADPGDPDSDVIWLSTGYGGAVSGDRLICAIPVSEWGSGNNPGASYFQEDIENNFGTNVHWMMQVDRANSVTIYNNHWNTVGILEPFGRADFLAGQIDQFDAPVGVLQTLHRNTGTGQAWTNRLIGKRIRISGGTNALNRGSFIVDSFTDGDTIVIRNSGGAATAVGEAAPWNLKGTEFDTFATTANSIGSWSNGAHYSQCPAQAYVDDTGIGHYLDPGTGQPQAGPNWVLQMHLASLFLWDSVGSRWYRRRAEHPEAITARGLLDGSKVDESRAAHQTAELTRGGVRVAFLNQNAGVNEFFADEFYTFGVSPGLFKDATQQITYGWDLYTFRTELLNERLSPKTASHATAVGGFLDRGSLAGVLTDNPFVLTTLQQRHLAHHQRRLFLNGTNGSAAVQVSTGAIGAATGWQVGLDVGADTVAEKLKVALATDNAAVWQDVAIDLYSATAAAGPSSWTLEATYQADQDHPAWVLRADAFNDVSALVALSAASRANEIIIDLAALGIVVAKRYWKVVFRAFNTETTAGPAIVGIVAYDGAGLPIGIPAAKRLAAATASDYLANHVLRATWLIDDDAQAGGTGVSSSGVTVTLAGGTFDTEIANGDFLRILDGSQNIVSEHAISSRDSGTQLTLSQAPETAFSAEINWEVARNADVRPRDDEGGGENQARFPAGEFEVYVCPVTGHIHYHDDAVTNGRVLRVEEHVKVKRSL